MTSMTVSNARADMHQLLEAVANGDEVTLTRHGTPVAVVVRPDTLRARRADALFTAADDLRDLVEAGRNRPLPADIGISADRATELVDEVRRDRSRH